MTKRIIVSILTSLALAACSDPLPQVSTKGEQLDLRVTEGVEEISTEAVIVQHWNAEEILASWQVRNGSGTTRHSRAVFAFEGQGVLEQSNMPEGAFDRIRVDMGHPRDGRLQLELRDSEAAWFTEPVSVLGALIRIKLKNLEFPLQKVREKLGKVRHMSLHFPKEMDTLTLSGITFLGTTPECLTLGMPPPIGKLHTLPARFGSEAPRGARTRHYGTRAGSSARSALYLLFDRVPVT